jgi:peptidoglycan/LPS O-acetylase OafA/YrhL
VFVAPFQLGILAYYLKDRGKRWRWAVLAAIIGLNAFAATCFTQIEIDAQYGLRSLAAGLTIWFLVNIPDAKATNKLVIGGGYSYGLYLLHVPLILFSFRVMESLGMLAGTISGVVAAGVFALGVGLTFGWLELKMYGRVKKLANLPVSSVFLRLKTRLRTKPLFRIKTHAGR